MKKLLVIGGVSLAVWTALAGEELSFERSMNMSTDRISAIELDVGSGYLNVTGGSGSSIEIEATIESDKYNDMERFEEVFEKKMIFTLERESEYAVLRAHTKQNLFTNPDIRINLDVRIPRDLDVVIDDGSGPMQVTDIDGSLRIDDGSGPVVLKRIGNDVRIDDGSGPLVIRQVSGDVDIEDDSGPIELVDISGSVEVDDGSGEVRANNIEGDFSVDDGSGDIKVDGLAGEFHLIDDGSGGIRVNGKRWHIDD